MGARLHTAMGARLHALLALVRFPLLPTAVADSAAGYLIALPPGRPPSPGVMAWLAAASACLYMAGMVLNDLADLERDRARHPGRPLPSGQVSRTLAKVLFAGLAAAGLLSASRAPARAELAALILVALILLVMILAYNLGLKRRRVLGSLGMGACRAFNLWMGMGAADADIPGAWVWTPGAVLGGYVAGITLVSTFEETRPGAARWVAVLLRGIIPLDAAMVLARGRPLEALLLLALLPLALALRRALPRHE
jgi:4-hydroxybenzoate polyprenyltransferase